MKNSIIKFFKYIYTNLFLINDTPQRISLGFGLGVFLGIVPGTGPLAALFFAMLFRVNRASSFLGSVLTNTWINIVTFLLAIKIGSAIMGNDWHTVYSESLPVFKDIRLTNLFKLPVFKIIVPIVIGYLVIAACAAIAAYLAVLIILKLLKHERSRIGQK